MHTYVIKLKKTQEVANTACKITEKVGGVIGKGNTGSIKDTCPEGISCVVLKL